MEKRARIYAHRKAVLSVDQINSFFEDGELPVPGATETIEPCSAFMQYAERKEYITAFVIENHPENSDHFKSKGLWDKHGVRGTWGVQFRVGLYLPKTMRVFYKGSNKRAQGYNGATKKLCEYLFANRVSHAYVFGLATNYCVYATSMGLHKAGFEVTLLLDACRGIDTPTWNVTMAIEKMKKVGIKISTTKEEMKNV